MDFGSFQILETWTFYILQVFIRLYIRLYISHYIIRYDVPHLVMTITIILHVIFDFQRIKKLCWKRYFISLCAMLNRKDYHER